MKMRTILKNNKGFIRQIKATSGYSEKEDSRYASNKTTSLKIAKSGKHEFPIIFRLEGNEETEACPFCGRTHVHGQGDGHRNAHCSTGEANDVEINGQVYKQAYGYVLVTLTRDHQNDNNSPEYLK